MQYMTREKRIKNKIDFFDLQSRIFMRQCYAYFFFFPFKMTTMHFNPLKRFDTTFNDDFKAYTSRIRTTQMIIKWLFTIEQNRTKNTCRKL